MAFSACKVRSSRNRRRPRDAPNRLNGVKSIGRSLPHPSMAVVDVIRRLREGLPRAGLRLTKAQVVRLCTADGFTSASALRAL